MVPYPSPVTRAQRGHQRNKKQDFVGGEGDLWDFVGGEVKQCEILWVTKSTAWDFVGGKVNGMKFWWTAKGDSNLADLDSDGQSKGVYASFQDWSFFSPLSSSWFGEMNFCGARWLVFSPIFPSLSFLSWIKQRKTTFFLLFSLLFSPQTKHSVNLGHI